MSGSNVSVSKHASFYIGTVTFCAEDCLFRVPREPFATESIVFRDMFLLPAGEDRGEEGKSDDNPIHLTEIKKEEFEQLLSVLFHRSSGASQALLPETVAQWKSVLRLAHMWGFQAVHKTAITNLEFKLPPVEKIAIGELYSLDFESWLLPAMQALVERQEPISPEEGLQLGLNTALKLASVREQVSYQMTRHGLNQSTGNTSRKRVNGCHLSSSMIECCTVSPIVGSRTDARGLDFSNVLRETFKTLPLSESCGSNLSN